MPFHFSLIIFFNFQANHNTISKNNSSEFSIIKFSTTTFCYVTILIKYFIRCWSKAYYKPFMMRFSSTFLWPLDLWSLLTEAKVSQNESMYFLKCVWSECLDGVYKRTS